MKKLDHELRAQLTGALHQFCPQSIADKLIDELNALDVGDSTTPFEPVRQSMAAVGWVFFDGPRRSLRYLHHVGSPHNVRWIVAHQPATTGHHFFLFVDLKDNSIRAVMGLAQLARLTTDVSYLKHLLPLDKTNNNVSIGLV